MQDIHNPHEVAVIGSCLADQKAFEWAFHNVKTEYFKDQINREIFGEMCSLYKTGGGMDLISLLGSIKSPVHNSRIMDISHSVPIALTVKHYANLLFRSHVSAELEGLYEQIRRNPLDENIKREIRIRWDAISQDQKTVISIKDGVFDYLRLLEDRKTNKIIRIDTGFEKLDELLGGFSPGNLVVVGARTSIGKTSLLLNLMMRFSEQDLKMMFASAEMTYSELMDRLTAMDSGIHISRLRKGNLEKIDFESINESINRLHEKNIHFIEGGAVTMPRIRNACESLKPAIVFVDFIQRFTPPSHTTNRAAFYSDIANGLKDLAKEKKIIIIAASQLNRDSETKEREPKLSDYKESGGIEEAGDYSIMLYAKEDDPNLIEREVTILVNKNRNGPCGKVEFVFDKKRTLFREK